MQHNISGLLGHGLDNLHIVQLNSIIKRIAQIETVIVHFVSRHVVSSCRQLQYLSLQGDWLS